MALSGNSALNSPYSWCASVLLCAMTSVGRWMRSTTLATVNVLPLPVMPSSTCAGSPRSHARAQLVDRARLIAGRLELGLQAELGGQGGIECTRWWIGCAATMPSSTCRRRRRTGQWRDARCSPRSSAGPSRCWRRGPAACSCARSRWARRRCVTRPSGSKSAAAPPASPSASTIAWTSRWRSAPTWSTSARTICRSRTRAGSPPAGCSSGSRPTTRRRPPLPSRAAPTTSASARSSTRAASCAPTRPSASKACARSRRRRRSRSSPSAASRSARVASVAAAGAAAAAVIAAVNDAPDPTAAGRQVAAAFSR